MVPSAGGTGQKFPTSGTHFHEEFGPSAQFYEDNRMIPISLGIIPVATAGTPVSITINSAAVVGWNPGTGPLITTSSSHVIKLAVDGGSAQTVTLPLGSFSKDQLISEINSLLTGATASLTARGNFMLSSNTHTASSSLVLSAVSNDMYALLGLQVGSYNSMPDTVGCKLVLRPVPGNTGPIYVGNSHSFNRSTGVGLLDILIKDSAGYVDRFSIEAHENENTLHTETFFIDADNNGDGVIGLLFVN